MKTGLKGHDGSPTPSLEESKCSLKVEGRSRDEVSKIGVNMAITLRRYEILVSNMPINCAW